MSLIETFTPFTGNGGESVSTWICHVDMYFLAKEVPENERFPFMLQHLSELVRDCVMSLTAPLEKISERSWEWDCLKLKVALREIENQIKRNGFSTEDKLIKAAKVVAVTGAACIAGPALIIGGLGLIGFSAIGPVAGSIAAGIQSSVYGGAVGAGSAFAFCQSLTMGGAGAFALAAGASGASAAAAATIKEIQEKPPSKTWEDGKDFRPSMKVIEELLNMLENGRREKME